jgi:hypothetical protein
MKLLLTFLILGLTALGLPQSRVKPNPPTDMDALLADVPPMKKYKYLTSTDTMRYYYDSTTVKRTGQHTVRAWIGSWASPGGVKDARWRQEKINMIEKYRNAKGYENYDRSLDLVEADCNDDRYRFLMSIDYANGEIIGSEETPKAVWSFAVPDTIGSAFVRVLCSVGKGSNARPRQNKTKGR